MQMLLTIQDLAGVNENIFPFNLVQKWYLIS